MNDADQQLARLSGLDRRLVPANRPWSEVTRPKIALQSIRFITPDVALVDAANSQYGSAILVRRVPLLMVMKRETSGWRVASLRVVVDLVKLPGAFPAMWIDFKTAYRPFHVFCRRSVLRE